MATFRDLLRAAKQTVNSISTEAASRLVASGYTNQEAADRLGVSVKTVEGYRSRVMRKLDAPNRATLVRIALQTGLLALTTLD